LARSPEDEPRKDPSSDQTILYAQDLANTRASMRVLSRRIASRRTANRTVLIADDDSSLRLLVSTTLSGDDYNIVEAENGVDALLLAKSHHPMLVLLDVNMPDLDGLEVCRRIKGDPDLEDVKVIMLTGAAQPDDHQAGLAAGADNYLTKPFRPLELLKLIDTTTLES
jgi:CheY-like chemotaxis protein